MLDENIYSHQAERIRPSQEQIETQLRAIFDLMSFEEKQKAIFIFKNNGLKGLMPMVLDVDEVTNKEIFEQRSSDEQVSSASNVSTQSKAG